VALASVVIPGGMLGPNGQLRIQFRFTYTQSTNGKTMQVNIGPQNVFYRTRNTASQVSEALTMIFAACGSQNAQCELTNTSVGGVPWQGASANTLATYSINMAVDQALSLLGQCSVGGELITLEGLTVEIMPG
jgi:hypothetical protein